MTNQNPRKWLVKATAFFEVEAPDATLATELIDKRLESIDACTHECATEEIEHIAPLEKKPRNTAMHLLDPGAKPTKRKNKPIPEGTTAYVEESNFELARRVLEYATKELHPEARP